MKTFSGANTGTVHVLRLEQGEDVIESVRQSIDELQLDNGVVVSGVGTLDYCRLHMVTTTGYPVVETFPEWSNTPLELVSMQGYIAEGVPHIHATVSDKQSAVSGHLEPGCRVLYLCEIVILELDGLHLRRQPNSHGIPTLEQ